MHGTGITFLSIDTYIYMYINMLNLLNWPLYPRILSFKNREIGILIWTQNLGIYFEQISVC